MSTWKDRLDSRIDTCPSCDDWRWDGSCGKCDSAGAVSGEQERRAA